MKTDFPTPTATALSVAFTGHRTIRPEHLERVRTYLASTIEQLYEIGCRDFYCGMAVGFDLLAAEIVIELKSICPQMRLIAAVPFRHQDRFYSEVDKVRYRNAIASSDDIITLSTRYDRHAYRTRNAFLIDHAAHVIAYYDNNLGISGTGQTIRMALNKRCTIHNLLLKM